MGGLLAWVLGLFARLMLCLNILFRFSNPHVLEVFYAGVKKAFQVIHVGQASHFQGRLFIFFFYAFRIHLIL